MVHPAVGATEGTPHSPAAAAGPVVGPERSLAEVTLKGVVLGLILAAALAAANAYLGIKVGMTVAASIPAAAVSLGVLSMFRRSTILENNQVQTIASAGASVVSGVIFTIPALVMMGAWERYHFWPIVGLATLGGVLGVMFSVPLRRALIVDMKLAFPEGVATAEVLKTGPVDSAEASAQTARQGRRGLMLLLEASGIAAAFKLLEGSFKFLAGEVAHVSGFLQGRWLFRGDVTLAPALLGVGYIVGPNIGILMLSGGVIGSLIAVPLHFHFHGPELLERAGIAAGTALTALSAEQWADVGGVTFSDCRRIGVGAMIVGGLWSVLNLLGPLAAGVRVSLAAVRGAGGQSGLPRTERDLSFPILLGTLAVSIVPLFLCFHAVLDGVESRAAVAGVMTVLMLVFGFLFTSVAGYMAGLVGSSNNPVSGVTMATIIASSLVLLPLLGEQAAVLGPPAVIFLAALICTGACIAGDNLQDLKCGHVVGATPWKQQLCLVLGTAVSALCIPAVLEILDRTAGIGRLSATAAPGAQPFSAPQATLMKDLSTGIFGGSLDWDFILIGCALAVVLILLDKFQERRGASFRLPVLAVAVGIYLPIGLSVLIFAGGLLAHYVARRSAGAPEIVRRERENTGLILAAGLITGESLMGVLVALLAAMELGRRDVTPGAGILSFLAIGAMAIYLLRRTLRAVP